jgi:hypothetical protein
MKYNSVGVVESTWWIGRLDGGLNALCILSPTCLSPPLMIKLARVAGKQFVDRVYSLSLLILFVAVVRNLSVLVSHKLFVGLLEKIEISFCFEYPGPPVFLAIPMFLHFNSHFWNQKTYAEL